MDVSFGGCVLFEQVEGDTVQLGEVLCGMVCTSAVEAFAETGIKHSSLA